MPLRTTSSGAQPATLDTPLLVIPLARNASLPAPLGAIQCAQLAAEDTPGPSVGGDVVAFDGERMLFGTKTHERGAERDVGAQIERRPGAFPDDLAEAMLALALAQ